MAPLRRAPSLTLAACLLAIACSNRPPPPAAAPPPARASIATPSSAAAFELPCTYEKNLRSRDGEPTRLRVTNGTSEPVRVYWLDQGGNRKPYGRLAPGESAMHITYEGHAWVLTDDAGQCAALAVAGADPREIRVTTLPPAPPAPPPSVFPAPPAALGLDAFYKKYVDADGIPIVASVRVDDRALLGAREIVGRMLSKRPDAREHIVRAKIRVAVMARDEQTLDIPEHADLVDVPTDTTGVDWNARARGLGATLMRPATSCGEENLLCMKGDRYAGENVLVHEFGHTIAQIGLEADADFQHKLQGAYSDAVARGLWKGTYAATNVDEYWAEGVQDWFDANLHDVAEHNEIHTRAQLATYDPALHRLLGQVFEDNGWRYSCTSAGSVQTTRARSSGH